MQDWTGISPLFHLLYYSPDNHLRFHDDKEYRISIKC
jgi:hypothetical protein